MLLRYKSKRRHSPPKALRHTAPLTWKRPRSPCAPLRSGLRLCPLSTVGTESATTSGTPRESACVASAAASGTPVSSASVSPAASQCWERQSRPNNFLAHHCEKPRHIGFEFLHTLFQRDVEALEIGVHRFLCSWCTLVPYHV